MSTSSTQHTPRRYHVPLRRVAADLVQLKYDALPFEIAPVYISFTLLALINIMAVCEFLKLADSFPEVITHDLLLTLERSSLLYRPSFPHPLLKSNYM